MYLLPNTVLLQWLDHGDVLAGACIIWYEKRQTPYTVLVGKCEDSLALVNLGVIVWKILKPRNSAQAVNILN